MATFLRPGRSSRKSLELTGRRVRLIATALLLVASQSFAQRQGESSGQLWKVGDRRWTVEEEARFGKWVDENVTEDFFIRHKIPTDCADVPYAIRWIYSRIAHLPAAATTDDGTLIGHWSTDWKDLPARAEWSRDPRFRAALLFLLAKTTTRTLPLDTYPVRIDRTSIIPGTVFLITESHSGLVGHVSLDGSHAHPIQTWESTLPVKIRKLNLRDFFSPRPEAATKSGLVKFRWAVRENGKWGYLPVAGHPFYSEEQYAPTFCASHGDYVEAVAKRIDPTEYDPWEKLARETETLTRLLRERVAVVLAGHQRCRSGGCSEGSDLWEIYSTPNRDGTIAFLMNHLTWIVETNRLDGEKVRAIMEAIPIEISKGRPITFFQVYQNSLWLSPDPEDPVEMRWGLGKCEMIRDRSRSVESSIAFVERTYRRHDPAYADLAIGEQRDVLRRLGEEWSRSQCEEPPEAPARAGATVVLGLSR